MSQPTSPPLLDLLTDHDQITLITLHELDQLNPVTLFPQTPAFADYVITAALRAQGRTQCEHLGKLFEPDPLPPEELSQGIFRRLVEGGVPDHINARSGVFMRCEPRLHEAIAAALNNLVGFDLARRSEQRCMRNDRSMRWVLPGGKLLTGTCKHTKHPKKRARARATSKVDTWIVSLSFDGTLVYWHAQMGEGLSEVHYSIEPSGRLVARALLQSYAAASRSKRPEVGLEPRLATKDERASVTGDCEAVPQDDAIDELEQNTPPLDREDGAWVRNKVAAQLEGVATRTLAQYRPKGIANSDKSLGRDRDGRVWRRPGTRTSHPWYLRSTLKHVSERRAKTVDKSVD